LEKIKIAAKAAIFYYAKQRSALAEFVIPAQAGIGIYNCERKRANQIYLAALRAAVYVPTPAYAGVTTNLLCKFEF